MPRRTNIPKIASITLIGIGGFILGKSLSRSGEKLVEVTIDKKGYDPVYEAYKILLEANENSTDPAIEEAIGYLGEALAE